MEMDKMKKEQEEERKRRTEEKKRLRRLEEAEEVSWKPTLSIFQSMKFCLDGK